jgi:hypothetical protein
MVTVKCPECGEYVVGEKDVIIVHCVSHWGVTPDNIERLTNNEAKRRYQYMIDACNSKEEV